MTSFLIACSEDAYPIGLHIMSALITFLKGRTSSFFQKDLAVSAILVQYASTSRPPSFLLKSSLRVVASSPLSCPQLPNSNGHFQFQIQIRCRLGPPSFCLSTATAHSVSIDLDVLPPRFISTLHPLLQDVLHLLFPVEELTQTLELVRKRQPGSPASVVITMSSGSVEA